MMNQVRRQIIDLIPLQDLIPILLLSQNTETNFTAISVLGQIFSWPEHLIQQLLESFEAPYDYLLHNFVKPYIQYFQTQAMELNDQWLNDPLVRCNTIRQCMWALSNIFADMQLANSALAVDDGPVQETNSSLVQILLDVHTTIIREESVMHNMNRA